MQDEVHGPPGAGHSMPSRESASNDPSTGLTAPSKTPESEFETSYFVRHVNALARRVDPRAGVYVQAERDGALIPVTFVGPGPGDESILVKDSFIIGTFEDRSQRSQERERERWLDDPTAFKREAIDGAVEQVRRALETLVDFDANDEAGGEPA